MNNEVQSAQPTARERCLQDLTVSLGVLQRTYRAAADKAIAHLGISQPAAWALMIIGRQGSGARHGVVAELLGVEGPTLVRTLDQLVAAGLIERREDAIDRRAKTLHITPAGAEIQVHIEAVMHELRARLFAGISDGDIETCVRVLSALGQALGRAPLQSVLSARGDA